MKRLRILGLMHRDIKPENFRFKDRATTTLQVGWLLNAYNTWSKVVLHVCMFACLRFDIFSHSPMFTATFASCWTLEGRRLRTKHQRRFLVDASLMLRWLVAKLSKAFYQLDW